MKQEIIDKINRLASQDEPFLFVINYQGDKAFIRQLSDINPEECLFDFEGRGNSSDEMKKWYGYIKTCCLINSWDTTAMRLNGAD